jgi:hypothetical protein
MNEQTSFTIGSAVACSDGDCGELRLVVVDPVSKTLAHLVVDPRHRVGAGRLVPIELVESSAEGEIRLSCTLAQFDELPDAEEVHFLPGGDGGYGYGPGQIVSLPYFGLGGMGLGMGGVGSLGMGGVGMGGMDVGPQPVVTDRVPVGEVAVRRGDPVAASDGDIGKVAGLVVDRSDHHVTHILLDEGHLWGHKRVAIPIGAVAEVSGIEGVRVKLTKDEIRDLPPIEVDAPG